MVQHVPRVQEALGLIPSTINKKQTNKKHGRPWLRVVTFGEVNYVATNPGREEDLVFIM